MDDNKCTKDKIRMHFPFLSDRVSNGPDVTLVTAAKRVRNDIIAEKQIDDIAFKTSKTNARNISIEVFVPSPAEIIL